MFHLATTRRGLCQTKRGSAAYSDTVAGAEPGRILPELIARRRGQAMPRFCPLGHRSGTAQATASMGTSGPSQTPLRGLLFDMGDVLYDATLWRRWLYQLLGRIGLHSRYRTLYRVWDEEFLNDVHRGRREFAEAFAAFLLSLGLSRGQIDEVQAASQARKRDLELSTRPLPGVRDTIEELAARGVKLAVLSDSEKHGDELQAHLTRLGLGGCFSPVISSIDLAHTKPSPVCYRAALTDMGMPTDAVAFVGHDAAELVGARAVGLRTVAFNYDAGAKADHYLTRFEELLQLVDSRGAEADALANAA